MEIKIRTKNFNSNYGVEELARKELARVEKMFAQNTIYDVCVKKEKNEANKTVFKCDITIRNGKNFVRGYGEGDRVEASIDIAVDSLKRKARKIKTFEEKKRKDYSKFIAPDYEKEPDFPPSPFDIRIEREKVVEVDTMNVEEAAMQMELLSHNFFVYKNEDGNVCVLYKREKGYGVITAM